MTPAPAPGPGPSVLEIVKKTTEFLNGRRIASPRLNAELLVGHALGLQRMQLYIQFERLLTEAELAQIRPLVRRRGQGEPVQYVVGTTDFHGLRVKVDRRALIPRPETEQLVEQAILRVKAPPARILDLGTGTGAIALALAKHFPEAAVTAVDASPHALALARENAEALAFAARVSLLESNWFSALPAGEAFDLILSNPPYLSADEVSRSAPEVKDFEPQAALVGAGPAGLGDLEQILHSAPRYLAPGGLLALETGPTQHPALAPIAREAGFMQVESAKDLAGFDRFIFAQR